MNKTKATIDDNDIRINGCNEKPLIYIGKINKLEDIKGYLRCGNIYIGVTRTFNWIQKIFLKWAFGLEWTDDIPAS